MAKAQNPAFFCSNCGYESSKWLGQCPSCRNWNTFTEAPAAKKQAGGKRKDSRVQNLPVKIREILPESGRRTSTGSSEMDTVLGGGIVKGSMILVGGDPGIGKSTLLLQVCRNLASSGQKVLYVSGEESPAQIKLRADRIGEFPESLYLMCETDLEAIETQIDSLDPDTVVVDSIQTMFSAEASGVLPGSVTQVRAVTGALLRIAKGSGTTVFIVGHVTKEGTMAGPRVLEHMVDTVLYFEGESHSSYRVLRSAKNRFGSTDELGVFEMSGAGLSDVPNASAAMLEGRPESGSGSVVVCAMEGTRPLLLEVQALVCRSNLGIPRRQAAGFDYNRVNILMAVLEKRGGLKLSDCDAYINVAGGVRVREPAMDLAVCAAIISSFRNRAFDRDTVIFGEVGLSGEVRSVGMSDRRLSEAEKLGFGRAVIPAGSRSPGTKGKIEITGVRNVYDVMGLI